MLNITFFLIYFRSNVSPDQPLRPKPPASSSFRVTPSPSKPDLSLSGGNSYQYGVTNPEYYSATPTPTEGYGPNDFIVETVKLDKAFFHQVNLTIQFHCNLIK